MHRLALLTVVPLLLSACLGGGPREPSPDDVERILGPVSATGVVALADLSLYRRGTHRLFVAGEERFFLEGRGVDLSEALGKLVRLQGDIQPNTHPSFLPVFVVQRMEVIGEEEAGDDLRELSSPSLGLLLLHPASWVPSQEEGLLAFRLATGSGGGTIGTPFLTVTRAERVSPSGEGMLLRVGARTARRWTDAQSQSQTVEVEVGTGSVVFLFRSQGDHPQLRDDFYRLLETVTFPEREQVESGGELGQPCGGSAGVLCPAGSYCRVTDPQEGSGRCVAF